MYCDCPSFRYELENLCNQVLAKGDLKLQWEDFEQFLMKYIGDNTHDISVFIDEVMSETPFTTFCSLKISSLLVHKLDAFRRRKIALTTLLVDLLTILHLNACSRSHVHRVWNFERSYSSDRGTLIFLGALNSEHNFKKLLLNFGLIHRLSGHSPLLMKVLERKFIYFTFSINDYSYNEGMYEKLKAAVEMVKRVCFPYEERECYKRMFLSVMAIHAIQMYISREDHRFIEECLSCFDMYFTGTPDAFLSVFEVKCTLYICFKLMNKLHLFDIYCQEFDKFMPGCPAKMEPRRLTHLVRCQIRQNLSLSNLPLPSAVDKLLLPKSLKKFLLGASRKRGNDSSDKSMTQSIMKSTKKRRLNDDDWELYILKL